MFKVINRENDIKAIRNKNVIYNVKLLIKYYYNFKKYMSKDNILLRYMYIHTLHKMTEAHARLLKI